MEFVQSLKNKGVKMDDNLREKLKAIAEKVLKQANIPNDEKFGSVIAILMMISIILTVIRVLQECNKNKTQGMTSENKQSLYAENIKSYSQKRGWFTRLRIKRIVRRELTPEEYNKYGIKLTEALLDIGENLKDDEVATLMEAANV
jgi:hypothetical protein